MNRKLDFYSMSLSVFFTLLFLVGTCMGKFLVEKNSLKVTSPKSLKNDYECAIGNFGIPQYGGSLVGIVVYPKSNTKACKSFDDFDLSFKSKPGGFPTFLLIDRGGEIPPFFVLFTYFVVNWFLYIDD